MKRVQKVYDVYWSPTGQKIATVTASTGKAAKRKAPHPYRRYLGEMYAEDRGPAAKQNPRRARVKLPAKWTPALVRVDSKGRVQVGFKNPAKLGSGGRFAKCVQSVEAKGGAYDPNAVCAAAGRRKYGTKKMAKMAKAGKRRRK